MSNINKTVIIVCVALFGAILAQEASQFTSVDSKFVRNDQNTSVIVNNNNGSSSGNSSSNHTGCGSVNVTLVNYRQDGGVDFSNVTLTRIKCNAYQMINFTVPVQNVTLVYANNFNSSFGDRFLVQSGNNTMNMTIVPAGTFSKEQEAILGNVLQTVVMIVRNNTNQTGGPSNGTFVSGEIVNDKLFGTVRLYPGWSGRLFHQMNQTIVGGPNTTFAVQNVTVAPGWYQDTTNRSMKLILHHNQITEYVTVFFVNAPVVNQVPGVTEFRYVDATVYPYEFQTLKNETFRLFPGWVNGPLKSPLYQTLVPGPNSQFRQQTVSVHPQWSLFLGDEGLRAFVKTGENTQEAVSIFFEQGVPALKTDHVPRYMNATLVPQYNQTFKTENVVIYPGWSTVLSHKVNQTMIAPLNSQFNSQNITVAPGWYLMKGMEAIRAVVQLENATDYVTFFLSNQTLKNLPKVQTPVEQFKLFN